MEKDNCETCGSSFLSYERVIHLLKTPKESSEIICSECLIKRLAKADDLKLEEFNEKIIEVSGSGNKKHQFYICRSLIPAGIMLEAIEVKGGEQKGYKVSVIGDIDCDQKALMEALLQKIRKTLLKKYIDVEELDEVDRGQFNENEFFGSIEYDEDYHGKIPRVFINGIDYSWEEFGNILMSYEGFNFKLQIFEEED